MSPAIIIYGYNLNMMVRLTAEVFPILVEFGINTESQPVVALPDAQCFLMDSLGRVKYATDLVVIPMFDGLTWDTYNQLIHALNTRLMLHFIPGAVMYQQEEQTS